MVWEKLDKDTEQWDRTSRTRDTYQAVGDFIMKYKKGQAEVMHPAVKGGYNDIYRLEYRDGSSAIMRVPIKGTYVATRT